MPKKLQKQKLLNVQTLMSTKPLSASNFGKQSEVDAYMATTGAWATIATIHSVGNVDSEEIADFIVHAVKHYNEHYQNKREATTQN